MKGSHLWAESLVCDWLFWNPRLDSQNAFCTWQQGWFCLFPSPSPRSCVSSLEAEAHSSEQPVSPSWGAERERGRCLRPHLSFSTSLPPFLLGSLTSLIYGEQSEKSSPSDVSLEAERRDKVSAGSGLGSQGTPALGGQAWGTE